jgi:hypothetical protein
VASTETPAPPEAAAPGPAAPETAAAAAAGAPAPGTQMPDLHLPGADVARPGAEVAIRRSDVPTSLPDMMHLAEKLADSDVLPAHLRRKPANVLAVMFASRALDIPMWTAFQVMHLVEGKVALDATFQRAMVVRAGHTFRIIERSNERAVAEITRHDDPQHPQREEFTYAEAVAAGLATKKVWQSYRRAMLVARVTTQIIRDVCPEVLFGAAYAPEELDMDLDEEGRPVAIIPSERVDANIRVRTPEERKALQEGFQMRIDVAATAADLNAIWADAKAENVLGAPLPDGTPVQDALAARAQEIKAADAAEETLRAAGLDPTQEPSPSPGDTDTAGSYPAGNEPVDADVVDEHPRADDSQQEEMQWETTEAADRSR